MRKVNPYLSYNGTCEEAFNFYKSVFGGEFDGIMRWGDNPQCEGLADDEKNGVLHISLRIGDSVIMGSDSVKAFGEVTPGTNFQVAVAPESREDADHIFTGLSDGGSVITPMADQFWGDYFGSLTDKFGIQWLINYGTKTAGE